MLIILLFVVSFTNERSTILPSRDTLERRLFGLYILIDETLAVPLIWLIRCCYLGEKAGPFIC